MTITQINTGSQPNDGTGDSLRQAFVKTNENFTELDSKLDLSVKPSPRIGEFFYAKSGMNVQGVIEVKPQRITNGAVDYPIWAGMYPEFINGNDILFPSNVDGMFLRNNGGSANTEGSLQSDSTARPNNSFTTNTLGSHTHTSYDTRLTYVDIVAGNDTSNKMSIPHSGESARIRVNESGAEGIRFTNSSDLDTSSSSGSHSHSVTGGGDFETRPQNRAYQLYTIVDSYNYSELNVINANSIEVQDQSSSGYLDIGNTRIQWGKALSDTDSPQVITFPQPFAEVPTITLSIDQGTSEASGRYSFLNPTTTQFEANRADEEWSNAQEAVWNWQAIGLKPE